MIDSEEAARAWLRALPEYDEAAEARLEQLVALLAEENRRQNLISAASLEAVWQRHIADSAQLLSYAPRGTGPWLDLGTGAGFPGLVVAVLRPELEVLVVESRARRIEWLDRARITLGLDSARVIGKRLEQVETRQVGVISARAFAPLPRLITLSARFSTNDTLWLLPKGRSAQQELDEFRDGPHMFHVEQSVTDSHSGIIVGKFSHRKEPRQ